MKDFLKTPTLYKGDIAYIYEYKNRNEIQSFDDLIKIKVDKATKNIGNILAEGTRNIYESNKIIESKEFGTVAYIQEGNYIQTSEGLKYISYYIENNKAKHCLKKLKDNTQLYKLGITFSIGKDIKIKTQIPFDVLFLSANDAADYIQHTKITHPKLNSECITFYIYGIQYFTIDYIIEVDGKETDSDAYKKKLFNFLCQNKKDLNNKQYNYSKEFSMKHSFYYLISI